MVFAMNSQDETDSKLKLPGQPFIQVDPYVVDKGARLFLKLQYVMSRWCFRSISCVKEAFTYRFRHFSTTTLRLCEWHAKISTNICE